VVILLGCAAPVRPHPLAPATGAAVPVIQASGLRIELTSQPQALWTLAPASRAPAHAMAPPVFPLDGKQVTAVPTRLERVGEPVSLGSDLVEHRFRGVLAQDPSLALEVRFRLSDLSPILRFQYRLTASVPHGFSRAGAEDELVLFGTGFQGLPRATEVRLSEFVELFHSYTLSERRVEARDFDARLGIMGPILVASDGRRTMLLAYEHGSQVPDAFLRYELRPDRSLTLRAVKGSYWRGQALDQAHPYETVWMQAGLVAGDEERTAEAYRRFVRDELSTNEETRQPRLYYNTWNFQERNRWWNGKRYLDSMNAERMLAEIEVAHRMGIETFVLDTGWYEKTGDWAVSRARFPQALQPIRRQLEGYGMKLGLSFNPTAAAASSRAYAQNRAYVMSRNGQPATASPVWETEESYPLCLVSPWGEAFLEELVRLHQETGVTYYKWDAVDQYGCDGPGHGHGTEANTGQERRDAYAFLLPLRLTEIARKLGERIPGSVVDYDVTEPGRAVGLAFLTAGRYHFINNGPYYQDDVPIDLEKDNWNLFFHKGPARTWITRSTYGYDKWIPSELFLTHYLPDDPEASQMVTLASLIVGHHGVWGDLPTVSPEGVARFGRILGLWRQVRDAMAAAPPVRSGPIGGTAEVHEKIDQLTGRGAVVIFATAAGPQRYVSEHGVVSDYWATPGTRVSFDKGGRAIVDAAFEQPGAAIVFFGVREGRQEAVR